MRRATAFMMPHRPLTVDAAPDSYTQRAVCRHLRASAGLRNDCFSSKASADDFLAGPGQWANYIAVGRSDARLPN